MVDLRIICINGEGTCGKSKGADLWADNFDSPVCSMPFTMTFTTGSSEVGMSKAGIVNEILTGFQVDTPTTSAAPPSSPPSDE